VHPRSCVSGLVDNSSCFDSRSKILHFSKARTFLFADIAFATTNEVDLFSEDGKGIEKLQKPSADLQSLEFDPVHQMLYLSDDTNSNYSIFSLSLEGNQDLRPFIQSK
jgi:hypothetical protein